MKCPKCHYLGFETGDRCKNCGYDFSLMADSGSRRIELDLPLRETEDAPTADWLASPLFTPFVDVDRDEPLIKLPAMPRAPLAVRRTPETGRRRMGSSPRRAKPGETPLLQFAGEQEPPVELSTIVEPHVSRVWKAPTYRPADGAAGDVSTRGARAAAAAIDHLMLGALDLMVVYFTLRMAGLPMDQWTALPAMPLIAFLLFIKLSYFCAFTAVGGQTIGKMAARIRVVSADDGPLDAASALRRTVAGLVSAIPLGLGFLPALLGADRRALHDRIARTRVIALPAIR